MYKALKSESGVTIIELIVGFAIITIVFLFMFSSLLFSQNTIIASDAKNNEAAAGQDIVDSIISQLEEGAAPNQVKIDGATNAGSAFSGWDGSERMRQYRIVNSGKGYYIYYRSYYGNGAEINYTAFANKGAVI
ncbi:hypothetical protein DSECCO2_26860 [anaerobic digester metagenome]